MFHVKLALSTAAYPNLTAMGRDVVDTGKQAAELLLKLIDGERMGASDGRAVRIACPRFDRSCSGRGIRCDDELKNRDCVFASAIPLADARPTSYGVKLKKSLSD